MKIVQVPRQGLSAITAKDIAADPAIRGNVTIQADAVVVGSGAGGAVAAYELAKAGKNVVILEAGRYVPSSDFKEILGDSLQRLYASQGAQPNFTGDLLVLQGACVGGSTVVNACTVDRAPGSVLASWKEHHGLDFTGGELTPYYEKIERALNIHINEQHEINACAHKVIQGCERMNYSWKPAARVVRECALTGHCLSGCASDRNQSMLVTYLPWAMAYGAKLYADTFVTRVVTRNGRTTGVEGIVRDPDTREVVAKVRVDTQVVVAAAGAIQTPALLMRSEVPDVSGMLGRNLGMNPFVQVLGRFNDPIYGWQGALSGVVVDEFLDSDGHQFVSGLAEPEQMVIQGDLGVGDSHMEFMKSYKYMAGINTFIADENQGRVSWKGGMEDGRQVIHWGMSLDDFGRFKHAISLAARIMFSAGAASVRIPTFQPIEADSVFNLDATLDQIDYGVRGLYTFRHYSLFPQGSCRMGPDYLNSVVNEFGEVHGVRGLFVTDASLFPSTLKAPPQLTVYALANYITDQIMQRAGNYFVS